MKTASIFLSMFAFTACVDQVEETDIDVEATPRLAGNALTPQQLSGASLNAGVLSTTNLNAMASTADGRASLPYVIGCALPTGASATAHWTDGSGFPAQQTFSGDIGLGSSWTTTALTSTQQRLVSSCVLARVNMIGTNVTVSLRGNSSALNVTATEASQYVIEEGAFFGNVFQGAGFYVAACDGSGTAPANRRCAQPNGLTTTECGFTYAGMCSDICTTGSSYYSGCVGPNGTTYAEPITTFLK